MKKTQTQHLPQVALENDSASLCNAFASGTALDALVNAERILDTPEIGPLVELHNRETGAGSDGWIQIVPLGEFANRTSAGRDVMQVMDRQTIDALAKSFKGELLINYDHLIHDVESPAFDGRAAGRFAAVEARDDGLYAKPTWTRAAKAAIEDGEYRFISPEFRGLELVAEGEPVRVRPTLLTGAGLTNKPNLKTLKPLSNRARSTGSGRETDKNQKTNTMNEKEKLLKLLGLPAEASDEQIETAYNRQTAAGDAVAKAANAEIQRLKDENKSLQDTLLNRDLEEFKDVIEDSEKEDMKQALLLNREPTIRLLKKIRAKADQPPYETVHNRAAAKAPDGGKILDQAAKAADAQEKEVREYMAKHRVGYETAFNAVRHDKPELFG